MLYEDQQVDFLQLLTLDVKHDRDDEDTIMRVMWMLQRSDLDEDTLSKQLDIDKLHKTHKRKAEFNGDKKTVLASKKRQLKPKKKRKNQPQEEELSENSDPLSELPSESEESDEAATETAVQAQPQTRYSRRNRKQRVEINIDHAAYRTGWGASDTQKRKKN